MEQKKIQQLPLWLVGGVLVFLLIAVTGSIIALVCPDEINPLFALIIPSIIFEEVLEGTFTAASDNIILNLVFIFVFWFGIGAVVGLLIEKLLKPFFPR